MRIGRSLLLLCSVTAAPILAHSQQPAKTVTISGQIVDGADTPIPSAEIGLTLDGAQPVFARADNDGKFAFSDVRLGQGKLVVRRLGYRARTVPLDLYKAAAGTPLKIDLESLADELDTVQVEGQRGRMEEFYFHKQTNNFGYFIDLPEIKKKNPRYVSELFRDIPGARIQVSRRLGNTITLRGCQPRIWVDGVKTQDSEVDEVANVDEVAAIEVYPSWAGTPPQYMDRETRACGTIVIWSRRQ